jgi:hypothetical protein
MLKNVVYNLTNVSIEIHCYIHSPESFILNLVRLLKYEVLESGVVYNELYGNSPCGTIIT